MKSWADRGRWLLAQLCWNDDMPDPRVLQCAFASTLLGVVAVRGATGRLPDLLSWPAAGIALTVLAAVVAVVQPRVVELSWFRRGVPVLDVAAVGMLAVGPELGGVSPLVVLPALWLGLDVGLRGAALAVASAVVFIAVPGLVLHGTDPINVERVLTLPLIAGIAAAAITFGVQTARAAQARAESREAELVEAMKVIERNRRSAQAIFEAVDVGLALLDADGEPMLINQRLAEFSQMAYPDGDLSASNVFDESGTSRLAVEDVPTSRARRGEEFDDVRVWIGAEPADRRAMSISARRVEDEEGNLLGAAVSYTDVTELMRALRVKEEFMALISHELRTPLTSISGYVAVLLEREDLDHLMQKHLAAVSRNADRLERLVVDLLDEAPDARSDGPGDHGRIDLAVLVRDSVVAARPHAERAGVRLAVEAPSALPFNCDARRLSRAIDNLVSNAIKYTGRGGHAQVRVGIEDEAVVIRVSDTGIGISPEDHGHVFTRFFRTREATLAAIQGVGLGLSITKAIVESHGGRIEIDSDLGRGSEFRVLLPMPVAAMLAS